jgi:hypothetical protein
MKDPIKFANLDVSRRRFLRTGSLLGALPIVGASRVSAADEEGGAEPETEKTAETLFTPEA